MNEVKKAELISKNITKYNENNSYREEKRFIADRIFVYILSLKYAIAVSIQAILFKTFLILDLQNGFAYTVAFAFILLSPLFISKLFDVFLEHKNKSLIRRYRFSSDEEGPIFFNYLLISVPLFNVFALFIVSVFYLIYYRKFDVNKYRSSVKKRRLNNTNKREYHSIVKKIIKNPLLLKDVLNLSEISILKEDIIFHLQKEQKNNIINDRIYDIEKYYKLINTI